MLPEGVLKLPRDERFILWVELARGRLTILEQQEHGGLIARKRVPISIGANGHGKAREGDRRTPVGVYRFTSFLADDTLKDYYGLGAYPLNYPNALDRRLNKTGSGIWLHGLPRDVEQRPRLDSDGCVVIDNGSLQEMGEYIRTGVTHVVLTVGEMKWQPATAVQTQKRELETAFEAWRQAWEAIDNDSYLSYYSQDFRASNRNKTQWDEYKKRVNGGKSSIRVEVSSQSMFANPEAPELISVRYYQRYQSDNYAWTGWKEQIWRKDDTAGWQIVYEGNG